MSDCIIFKYKYKKKSNLKTFRNLIFLQSQTHFTFTSMSFIPRCLLNIISAERCISRLSKLVKRPHAYSITHPAKIDLNKKQLPKPKTIQNFNIDAQRFRKTRIENPPTPEIGVTSQPVPANLPLVGRSSGMVQLVTPIYRVGGFSFLVFLNPWASILKF